MSKLSEEKIESLNFVHIMPVPGYQNSLKKGILAKDGYEIVNDPEGQRYLITWVHPQTGVRSRTYFANYANCAGGIIAPLEKAKAVAPLRISAQPKPTDDVPKFKFSEEPVDVKPAAPKRKTVKVKSETVNA